MEYGAAYLAKYREYAQAPVDRWLNGVRYHLARPFGTRLLDVGVGSGSFLDYWDGPKLGTDVNPLMAEWLKTRGWWTDMRPFPDVDVVTCWDSFEHMPNPDEFLDAIPPGVALCLSLPVFGSLDEITASKHFRPDEHYTYWTPWGLAAYLARFGFGLCSYGTPEVECGREAIGSFAFSKR